MSCNNSKCCNLSSGKRSVNYYDTERTVIQATKIFDACISQDTFSDIEATVNFSTPVNGGLCFVSANSVSQSTIVSDVSIEPIDIKSCKYRVKANITLPIIVTASDSSGFIHTGTFTYTVPKDIIMCLKPSTMQYSITATATVTAPSGSYLSGTTFNLNLCVTLVTKATMQVELVLPSYGYAQLPECTLYEKNGECEEIFSMPLYPTTNPTCNNNSRK